MTKTVLVVDDEHLIVDTLAEVLAWEGYEVVRASNGVAALDAIAAAVPDLLLIDFMMPLKDGITAIRELRAQPRTAHLPIVLMTAAPPRDALVGHYDALLIKPFKVASLLAAIGQALRAHPR